MAISAKDKAEIERKAKLGLPLDGSAKGSENWNYYQYYLGELQKQKAGAIRTIYPVNNYPVTTQPVKVAPSGSVTVNPVAIPATVATGVNNYGYTGIVVIGGMFLFFSLLRSFRSVRR